LEAWLRRRDGNGRVHAVIIASAPQCLRPTRQLRRIQKATASRMVRVTIAIMGPLTGVRVLEFEAIGPGPFCGMLLADMGADVLLVDRPQDPGLGLRGERWSDVMLRGRRSVTLDLK